MSEFQRRRWESAENRAAMSEIMRQKWAAGVFRDKRPQPKVKPALAARARELRCGGYGTNDIARRLGVSKASVWRWAPTGKRPELGRGIVERWDVTDAEVSALRASGLSWDRIARQLGCSTTCVVKRAKKLGLPRYRVKRSI